MDQYNHFGFVPSTISKTKKRSTFKYHRKLATTGALGFLYPMGSPIPMMPDSTLEIDDFRCEVRSQAMVAPLMDELYLDIFAVYVANRIVWEHWEQFLGATDNVLFDNLSEYHIPYINFLNGLHSDAIADWQWQQHLACHFELPRLRQKLADKDPTDGYCRKISALPFRGYNFIWNEYFRPEQCIAPILFSKTDRGNSGNNIAGLPDTLNPVTIGGVSVPMIKPGFIVSTDPDEIVDGGCVLPVYRAHRSLWTSCLPKPSLETVNLLAGIGDLPVGFYPNASLTTASNNSVGVASGEVLEKDKFNQISGFSLTGDPGIVASWKDVSLTVNGYRETIMLQNYYDCLNRAGSRYGEILANLFDVVVNPKTIGIPLLITHKRFTIYRNQIEATADSDNTQVGSQKGYIDTICRDYFFNYTADEHSYIHLLWCIRAADIRMSDGIEPHWQKFDKFDLYYKQFDGLGDVARFKEEIAIDRTADNYVVGTAIFGYQEYGAEEKYQRNSAVGFLDYHCLAPIRGYTLTEQITYSDVVLSADYYSYLSCIPELDAFAQCLHVPSLLLAPQFIIDFRLDGKITKPMPVYNIPGDGALL